MLENWREFFLINLSFEVSGFVENFKKFFTEFSIITKFSKKFILILWCYEGFGDILPTVDGTDP